MIKIILLFILLLPISIKAYDNNAIVFIGDSYGVGYSQASNSYYAANPYPNIIGEQLGVIVYNYSDISRGIIAKDYKNKSFLDGLEESNNVLDNKDNIIWVIIMGGFNDTAFKSTDIVNNGIYLINKAKEYYPNANIAIGMCGRRKYSNTFMNVVNAYKEIARNTSVYYIDGIEDVLANNNEDLFFQDNFHPNSLGQQKLADYIQSFLMDKTTELFVIDDTTRMVEDKNETVNILDSISVIDTNIIEIFTILFVITAISITLAKKMENK